VHRLHGGEMIKAANDSRLKRSAVGLFSGTVVHT